MADSIKFNGHYIDTTGTWDSTSSKTQAVINTEKLNIADLQNNLVTTVSGYALDARAGKTLNDNTLKLDGSSNTNNLASVTDLNTFFSGITLTNSALNRPAPSGWDTTQYWLIIAAGGNNTIKQVAIHTNQPSIATRQYDANLATWTSWVWIMNFWLDGGTLKIYNGYTV